MAVNDWQLGTLYVKGGLPGYFTQPGGPNTVVYPKQVQASSDYLSIKPFTEYTAQYLFGCEHAANEVMVFTDWDYDTNMSVALLCCPLCSFVQRTIEPASDAIGPSNAATLLNSILYP
jgi:hypothetical protein